MMEESAVAVAAAMSPTMVAVVDNGMPMWIFYAALAVIGMLIGLMLYFANRDKDNPFEIWQFVATMGKEGKYHPDITKLGQWHGIIASSWVAVALAAKVKDLTAFEYGGILVVCLLYLAGVQMFQAVMKARGQGNIAPPPAPESVKEQQP
jgi:hypothetical protein